MIIKLLFGFTFSVIVALLKFFIETIPEFIILTAIIWVFNLIFGESSGSNGGSSYSSNTSYNRTKNQPLISKKLKIR